MKKFIKFLLMSISVIFMFVACGGSDKEKTEATPETQGSNELVIYSPNADDEVNKNKDVFSTREIIVHF